MKMAAYWYRHSFLKPKKKSDESVKKREAGLSSSLTSHSVSAGNRLPMISSSAPVALY